MVIVRRCATLKLTDGIDYGPVCREQCLELGDNISQEIARQHLDANLDYWLQDGCSDLVAYNRFTCLRMNQINQCPSTLVIEKKDTYTFNPAQTLLEAALELAKRGYFLPIF